MEDKTPVEFTTDKCSIKPLLDLPSLYISGLFSDKAFSRFRSTETSMYLWSVMVDDAGSIFSSYSESNADKLVFLDKGFKSSLKGKYTRESGKMLSLSDLFLLSCYTSSVLSFPMFFSFLGMHKLYRYQTLRYLIIGSLQKTGYITSISAKSDLPVLGNSVSAYYTITASGLSYLRAKFPELYLPPSHMVVRKGGGKILHDYHARMSVLQLFSHIARSTPDRKNLKAAICYEELVPSYLRYSSSGINNSGDLRADALVSYAGSHFFIEQDMFTENDSMVIDKFRTYCDRCGFGPYVFDAASSAVLFCTHTPNVPAGEGGDLPGRIVMSNPEYFSSKFLSYLADGLSDFCCRDVLAGEGAIFAGFVDRIKDLYPGGGHIYAQRLASGRIDEDISALLELVRYYYREFGYPSVSDTLKCHSLPYRDRYELPEGVELMFGTVPLYNAAYSASLQGRPCDKRLDVLRNYCLDLVRSLDYNAPADDVITAICAGMSFQVLPGLLLGRYMDLIDTFTAEGVMRPVAALLDCFLYGGEQSRNYYPVLPGHNLDHEEYAKLPEITASHALLRIRNAFISETSSPICFEYAWDACSAARVLLHMKYVLYAKRKRMDMSQIPRIVFICRDLEEISNIHRALGNKIFEDLSGKEDPLLLFYSLVDDMSAGRAVIYVYRSTGPTPVDTI